MSLLTILQKLFAQDRGRMKRTPARRIRYASPGKHIIVRQNGYQERYRVNRYGEVFEE